MKRIIVSLFLGMLAVGATDARAEKLTIARLVASPSLDGETVAGLKVSPDGSHVTFLQGKAEDAKRQDLWEYDMTSGEARLLVDSDVLLPGGEVLDEVEKARRERQRISASGIIEYSWSPDSTTLMFPLGGDLYLLPLVNEGKADEGKGDEGKGGEPRQLTETEAFETDARFSPDGRYVSYIREQNLYVTDLSDGKERAITTEGAGTLSFGMADFAAQEEMGRYTGYWWSPDERYLAYVRVDESTIDLVDLYEGSGDDVKVIPKRYPFAGTPNALVELHVINLEDGSTTQIDMGNETDIYLARVDWLPTSDRLSFQRQSRDQKLLELIIADIETGMGEVVVTEAADTWVNLTGDLNFLSDGDRFIWTSERSGYRHVYLYDQGELRQLTKGAWAVADENRRGPAVRAVDEDAGLVYFEGYADTPLERHLYSVSYRNPGDITKLTAEAGWHSTTVSTKGGYFIDFYSSPDTPPRTALKSVSGDLMGYVRENALDENHPYFPYVGDQASKEFGVLEAEDGSVLHYFLMRPTGFDPSKKYPVVVKVYGGPGAQIVNHKWSVDFNQILAQNGIIVFSLDNRGSTNRGKVFEDALYRSMGDVELTDQLVGVDFLKTLDYVDADNIGITGGSYGGFMTLMALFKAGDVFKAGAAHAPVTDWRLYDTHYTERYLGDPNAPGDVYENSSVFKYIDGYKGGLLVDHGITDDNVFFDNTLKLSSALMKARKPFDMTTSAGQRHGLSGEAAQSNYFRKVLDFFRYNLNAGDNQFSGS